ncbi:hypothetical protein [Nonomuraea sp. bgisy101]|uniref:hypothetical protein n=1 Tax=Nonomuraea sp. bgisy101 TaxID=3413784 RepID=UPI003D705205
MAFPQTPLPLTVELNVGTWTNITTLGHVYRRDQVDITRGRSDESGQVDRSTLTATINNRDGRYSPRNPTGPHYGLLGRNTPIRASLAGSSSYLALDGTTLMRITTPDHASLDITGDIDIRVDCTLGNWRSSQDLAGKYDIVGNQRSWAFYLYADNSGKLGYTWSATGTATTTVLSTKPAPAPGSGRQAVRITHDVNNGAGGNTVVFYTAPTMAGPWTQLGDPVVTAGTTSIFSSSAELELGDNGNLTHPALTGQVHAFELRNGIGGSPVANPDFSIQTPGASSFVDAAGRTWTVQVGATISNRRWRFHGEIASLPQRWDTTGTDVYVPIEAAGIMRRLGTGTRVDGSVMYRAILRDTFGLVAYWPFEDEQGSQQAASALATHQGMAYIGSPEFGDYSGFDCSLPIMTLNGGSFTGAAPTYTVGVDTQIRWLMHVPAAGAEDNQAVLTFYCTGSARRWECHYGTGGTLGLRAYDSSGTLLFDSGDVAFGCNGKNLRVSVQLTESGGGIDWTLLTLEPGASSGLQTGGTLASNTVGRVGQLIVSPNGGITGISFGHLSVQNFISSLFDLGAQLNAWKGERAGRRIERLCREEAVTFRALGDLDTSTRMGVQVPGGFLDLLRGCADADGGMLYEPREVLGIGYRTRESLYNQTARVALDYDSAHLADSLDPTDDDQLTRNDVTVTREGGSSARVVQETGAMSVLAPPSGVGRYDVSETINVQYDLDLFDQAGWRLHTGTVDEARYPQISVDLSRSQIAGSATLTDSLRLMEIGDRLTVTDPPSWMPPEQISQIVQGYTEVLANFEHKLVINCSPESPYQVAVYDGAARYGPHSTVTNEALDTTETGVDITTPTGPLWSTTSTGYDVMIGGERMTVTAVSAPSGTNQTLTVIRSVNGIVKSHASGAQVQMFQPAIYAL